MKRDKFRPPFLKGDLPAWQCPTCNEGVLAVEKKSYREEETSESKKWRGSENWEPDWTEERFSVLFRCSHCQDPVFVVGIVKVREVQDENGAFLMSHLAPTFFEAAPPIIHIPSSCPKEVRAEILSASALYWSSPPSAANRIRIAVELLMDDQKITRRAKKGDGTFRQLSLHERIKQYSTKKPEYENALTAVKWLGNRGSHTADLVSEDVLDAFELLERALEEVYEAKSSRLVKLASAINKKKGPVPKRR